jgi:hypothetical protein
MVGGTQAVHGTSRFVLEIPQQTDHGDGIFAPEKANLNNGHKIGRQAAA